MMFREQVMDFFDIRVRPWGQGKGTRTISERPFDDNGWTRHVHRQK